MAMRQAEGFFILCIGFFHFLLGADNGIAMANMLAPVLAHRRII